MRIVFLICIVVICVIRCIVIHYFVQYKFKGNFTKDITKFADTGLQESEGACANVRNSIFRNSLLHMAEQVERANGLVAPGQIQQWISKRKMKPSLPSEYTLKFLLVHCLLKMRIHIS